MALIHEHRIFADRSEAGEQLATLLFDKYNNKNALVLGIPRGGVVVAYEVAKRLHAELSIVITKKLPHPLYEEFAIGSTSEDGSFYLTEPARRIDKFTIDQIVRTQQAEIRSRIQRFRKGKPLPEMKGRIVILVDDGIATGSTIIPAIKLCKHMRAKKVVVAAPVSSDRLEPAIISLADEIVIAERPELFHSVGQVYLDFHHLEDIEVIELLNDFEARKFN